jgi:hypothetical protein
MVLPAVAVIVHLQGALWVCLLVDKRLKLRDQQHMYVACLLPSAHDTGCRYTPMQVAAGVGVAATVLAGGVAAAKSPAVSDALSEQADWAWERLESVVPPLQVG